MAELFTQAGRLIAVDTPLGRDKLLLRSFTGSEGVSRLFHFQLEMLSEDPDIEFDKIIGQKVTIRLTLADGTSERYFHGYVSRFTQLPGEGRLARYQAEVVPWLWFLTRTADCRVFQFPNMTVPAIVQAVFNEFGFKDYETGACQRDYEPWEYCVQYHETACNFVMRLMEQEGIFFFFRHEEKKHVLVMADSPTAHKPCPGAESVRYEHVFDRGYHRPEDVILRWRHEQELRPGKYAVKDYNFKEPSTILHNELTSSVNQGGNRKYEVFEYPGGYETLGQGDALTRLRIEELEAPHEVIRGDSNCRLFSPGFRFGLTSHERKAENTQYALTEVTHSAHSGSFYAEQAGEGATYANNFTCIPYSVPFRPPRVTPKPRVQGPQTAVVVGPGSDEIYTDEYGRVKVQFHWDRRGEWDENSSCWIRVSQPWAGKNWGAVWIPRVEQEVVVDFLEGDPDRPIITGRVYNAKQMPPYELPANQTQSGFKSRSSEKGGAANFNEIRFEDKKGSEEIHVNAERNLTTVVEADESRSVGGSRSTTIKKDETLVISDGNRKETLEKGNDTLEIRKGNRDATLTKGNDSLLAQTGNIDAKAPAGKHSVTAKEASITGTVSVTLTCGGSTIKMTPASIDISSPLINIKGGMVKINS